ncbi:histidine kinase [Pontiellaceae bacterium B12219]|nr:histidine kinase [Pontiellaceae bacterium B12219]
MRRIAVIAVSLLLGGLRLALADLGPTQLEKLSLPELEQRLADTDAELEQLASYTLRGGTGSLGYRSKTHNNPSAREWVEIEFGEEVAVDQVILVPALWRAANDGLLAEGFPTAFRILAGTAQTTNVVASFSEEDNVLPRIAPLAVSFPPVKASWAGIETSTLSPMIRGDLHMLQLSEIMVFSGQENVALNKPIKASSFDKGTGKNQFLTDGFTPYLMDAAEGLYSATKLIRVNREQPAPHLQIDLQTPSPVNQINLHTADVALSIPMQRLNTWAVPRHVRATGANRPDFSDATTLCEFKQESLYDNGPIIMRRFPETTCRYIRIVILDPRPIVSAQDAANEIAFTEIEVFSGGQNIARGAPVTHSSGLRPYDQALLRITDGLNYYGKILPIRDWMNQLARRHDLEIGRPLLVAEMNIRYARQKTNLHRLAWLAAILGVGIAFAILIERFIHLRHLTLIKERFAADLHDELGANLHTIGLLSDLAEETQDSPDEQNEYLQRIRTVTERSGKVVRNVADLHESSDLFTGLRTDMQRAAERIVRHLEHDLAIEGEEYLPQLKPQRCVSLFLFYKECLINICRHSGATRLCTRLTASTGNVCLEIVDNGRGLPDSMQNGIPPSLKRRAKLLRAKLTVESPAEGGTRITLTLKSRKLGFIK